MSVGRAGGGARGGGGGEGGGEAKGDEGRETVYAVGNNLTAVDAYLLIFYRWGKLCGMQMRERYPRFTKLVEGLVKREEVVETLEVEGLDVL